MPKVLDAETGKIIDTDHDTHELKGFPFSKDECVKRMEVCQPGICQCEYGLRICTDCLTGLASMDDCATVRINPTGNALLNRLR